jgi:hypothetical protein
MANPAIALLMAILKRSIQKIHHKMAHLNGLNVEARARA